MCSMYKQFHQGHSIPLEPSIQVGQSHSHHTRTSSSFAGIVRFNLKFSQRFFRYRVNHILNVVTPLVHDFCCILMCMLYLYCVCYVVFIYRACCVVLSCMLYCTYSYVCICVLWQGRTALADCPEFKLLIKSNQITK